MSSLSDFVTMYKSICQICCTGAGTPKYHAADKHDTPPSHLILTLSSIP